jgi:hypothetical protein
MRNIFLFAGVASLFVGVLIGDSITWGRGDCRVPSSNTKYCATPENWVDDCTTRVVDCTGESQYVVNQFPDGTTESNAGHTQETREDCYVETKCYSEYNPPRCEVNLPLPTQKAIKIVPKDSTPCE